MHKKFGNSHKELVEMNFSFSLGCNRGTVLIYPLSDRAFQNKNPSGVYYGETKHSCDHVTTGKKMSSGTLAVLLTAAGI